jgi:hypothetical protein
MSVLRRKRSVSKLEVLHNAWSLQKTIIAELLRDFGVKPDKKTQVTGEDGREHTIIDRYPDWLIQHFRGKILENLDNLLDDITAANTIYPTEFKEGTLPDEYTNRVTQDELADRRRYQTRAIIHCQRLTRKFQQIKEHFPVSLEKYRGIIEGLSLEVRLLKGWRKSTNELASKLGK